jgi:hypothetical protein
MKMSNAAAISPPWTMARAAHKVLLAHAIS